MVYPMSVTCKNNPQHSVIIQMFNPNNTLYFKVFVDELTRNNMVNEEKTHNLGDC